MEQDVAKIKSALNSIFPVNETLIEHKISVDFGVTTLDGNPTMREFVLRSINRLQNEKKELNGALSEEGKYALLILERIQKLINENLSAVSSSKNIS